MSQMRFTETPGQRNEEKTHIRTPGNPSNLSKLKQFLLSSPLSLPRVGDIK